MRHNDGDCYGCQSNCYERDLNCCSCCQGPKGDKGEKGDKGQKGDQGVPGLPGVLEYANAYTGLASFQLIADGAPLRTFTGSTTSNNNAISPINGTGDIILEKDGVYFVVYRVTAYEDGPFAPLITTFRVSTALTLNGVIVPGSQALQNVLVGGTIFGGENQLFPTASDVTGTTIISTVGAQGTQILNLINNSLPLLPGIFPATLFRNVSITVLKIR